MVSLKEVIARIDQQAGELKKLLPMKNEYQQKLDKKLRLEFNYNSNHIEGNTLTYGETELLLIFDQTKGNHELREYEEMKAHDVALKMIKEEIVDEDRPLTEHFIRLLNECLLVRPFWKDAITPDGQSTRKHIFPGQYKTTPNSVRLQNGEIFHYSSPSDVAIQMSELVQWYNANEEKEHPLILAALLHYRFVRIHPFDDGNGRVARLLMNYVLLKHSMPLIIIKSDDKKKYLAALNRADAGDVDFFAEYIGEQLLWSLDIYTKAAIGEIIEEEDDLDKELALLKKELTKQEDNFIEPRSSQALIEVLDKSIIPLAINLNEKLSDFKDLFVDIEMFVPITGLNKEGRRFTSRNHVDRLIQKYKENGSPYKDSKLDTIEILMDLKGLRKSQEYKEISLALDISFDKYHFMIKNKLDNYVLKKIPYGKILSTEDIKLIVNQYVRRIIDTIRQETSTP